MFESLRLIFWAIELQRLGENRPDVWQRNVIPDESGGCEATFAIKPKRRLAAAK